MLPLVTATFITAVSALPRAAGLPGLNDLALAAGKLYYGIMTDTPQFSDEKYMSILNDTSMFGQLSVGNSMKWGPTEPNPGEFDFSGGDWFASIARSNGQKLRCHALVWHAQLPPWLEDETTQWTNETLLAAMDHHIKTLVHHWAPDCYAWDVVNEALEEDGSYRKSIFYNVTGPDYIPIAFELANKYIHEAGYPDTQLFYNDYNIEYPGPKSDGALKLVKDLQARGVRIDALGLQSHFSVGDSPTREEQMAVMESAAELDIDVAITELDIRFARIEEGATSNATAQTLQGEAYNDAVGACAQVERCIGITMSDFTDRYSWTESAFPGSGAQSPWDKQIEVKPVVFQGIVDALEGN